MFKNKFDFLSIGLIRDSSKDFYDLDKTFRCYLLKNLRVFYCYHNMLHYILIRIPYMYYNFTYEEAKKEPWYNLISKWYGCTEDQLDLLELKNDLSIIEKGIKDLENSINREDIDASILNRAYREEIHSAKCTLKMFAEKFDWIHADQNVRNSTTIAYKNLKNIVESDLPNYEKSPLKIKRLLKNNLDKYGFIDNNIHFNINILVRALAEYFIDYEED